MTEQKSDILDRAVAELLLTPGCEQLPQAVVERTLNALRTRQAIPRLLLRDQSSFRQQVAWWPLLACVLLMVTGSWVAGFHGSIWSREAGHRINPDGSVWVHYTDGRVVLSSST